MTDDRYEDCERCGERFVGEEMIENYIREIEDEGQVYHVCTGCACEKVLADRHNLPLFRAGKKETATETTPCTCDMMDMDGSRYEGDCPAHDTPPATPGSFASFIPLVQAAALRQHGGVGPYRADIGFIGLACLLPSSRHKLDGSEVQRVLLRVDDISSIAECMSDKGGHLEKITCTITMKNGSTWEVEQSASSLSQEIAEEMEDRKEWV